MQTTLLVVSYDLSIPARDFLDRAPEAARIIADLPGLIWKIWSLDRESGEGTSAYLFAERHQAEAFANGPLMQALRDGPARNVTLRFAPVERDLSERTHAAALLAA